LNSIQKNSYNPYAARYYRGMHEHPVAEILDRRSGKS